MRQVSSQGSLWRGRRRRRRRGEWGCNNWAEERREGISVWSPTSLWSAIKGRLSGAGVGWMQTRKFALKTSFMLLLATNLGVNNETTLIEPAWSKYRWDARKGWPTLTWKNVVCFSSTGVTRTPSRRRGCVKICKTNYHWLCSKVSDKAL